MNWLLINNFYKPAFLSSLTCGNKATHASNPLVMDLEHEIWPHRSNKEDLPFKAESLSQQAIARDISV